MEQTKNFVSIGAGNVATHLVKALCNKGYHLNQVYSRTLGSAKALADLHDAEYTNSPNEIITCAGFYLVSVPDQVLPTILNSIEIHDQLIFHTAGSCGLEVFGKKFMHFGVLYPLQTFSKNVSLNISKDPILIEASDNTSLQGIEHIARTISEKVFVTDSETRRWIHLAAVFACNFTNHMLVLSDGILHKKQLDPTLLQALIKETFRKSLEMDPAEVQTGPAVRDDTITIDKHIKMLEDQPLLQKIYTFTSESIRKTKSSRENKSGK